MYTFLRLLNYFSPYILFLVIPGEAGSRPSYIFPDNLSKYGEAGSELGHTGHFCSPHSLIYGTTKIDGQCPAVLKTGNNSYRALVFDPMSCHCYPVYSQGPCAPDQWLVVKDGTYKCDLNPCLNFQHHRLINAELIQFRGTCVELNKPHAMCGRFEHVTLAEDGFTPKCTLVPGQDDVGSLRSIAGVSRSKPLKCPSGYKLSGDQECYPVVLFEDVQL